MKEPGTPEWRHDARRAFLIMSVTHNQDAIRGTDTKASVALVLHGIIFSGVITATKDFNPHFHHSGSVLRYAFIVLLATGGLLSALSVLAMVLVVSPSPPGTIPREELRSHGYYFPQLKGTLGIRGVAVHAARGTFREHIARLEGLTSSDINAELAVELLRISALRTRKTKLASVGFRLLAAEVVIIVVYLALLGAHGAA